ncbi:uncharacterized protein LOC128737053 [Sabethes cyaneus]|uniref:uncharacterized protein LOC128737053 n=1 Tax=Sabethes cyaneus TaxID=53552 RepID=UPI00237D9026|nr:uncharacterized protein LOC128737053 [Sabethes cyaneus]
MHRKRYFPADLYPHPLHYAALRGYDEKVQELVAGGANIYEPIQDGETPAHVAITEGLAKVAEFLVQQMQSDVLFVREYLVDKFQCSTSDHFWLKRPILLALDEKQCEQVNDLIQFDSSSVNFEQSILVLVKYPKDHKSVVVVNSASNDPIQLFKIVINLLKNGQMNWDSTGPRGECETLTQLAAYHGNKTILGVLIESGADLKFRGVGKRTPLHSAYEASQKDIVRLLITKYADKIDPTARDENYEHILHYIINRQDGTSFKMVLDAMMKYRQIQYGETPSQAFNFIFKLDYKEWFWAQVNSKFCDNMIRAKLEKYQYDLTYHWEQAVALIDLITYRKARSFYVNEIQKEPNLLKVSTPQGYTALHALISANELLLIEELYRTYTWVKEIFECDAAIVTLNGLMTHENIEMMEFVLEKHKLFFEQSVNQIRDDIVAVCSFSNYSVVFEILLKYLPELKPHIEIRQRFLYKISYAFTIDYNTTYENLINDFPSAWETLQKAGKTLDDYNNTVGSGILQQAISENQLKLIKQLLKAGVNFDCSDTDTEERHAIHYVKTIPMLQLLIASLPEGRSLIHRKDRNGMTLLHVLCPETMDNKQDLILELLRLGAKVDERSNDQATALFFTYREDLFLFFTKELTSKGFSCIDPDLRDFEGKNALHKNLRHRNTEIASVMLREASTWVNFTDRGDSYLAYLVDFEDVFFNNVFKPILEANPDKTTKMFNAELSASRERCSELFLHACLEKNVYCMERFLEMDLDFNYRDYRGLVPILSLLSNYHLPERDILYRLLEKVDINVVDGDGKNILIVLCNNYTRIKSKGYAEELAMTVIDRKVNVNHVDNTKQSALHYAFKSGEIELIEILLNAGADYSLKNADEKLPFEEAPGEVWQVFSFLK